MIFHQKSKLNKVHRDSPQLKTGDFVMAIYFLDLLCLSAFGLRKFSIDYEVLDLLATLLTPFLSSLLGSYPINLNIRNGKKLNFICVCQEYAGILDPLDGIFS